MANLISISSVAAEKTNEGTMQIVARWKDSKDKVVSPANRVRAIELPANLWQNETHVAVNGNDEMTKMLKLHIHDSIADLAKQYLATICEESNMQRTQVPIEHFTLSALLQWQSEQAAISGRLNGEEIRAWLSQSATIKAVSSSHGEQLGKALGEQFVKLASPNHGLTPEKAAKLLSSLWQPEDTDTTTGLRVQMRLTAISKKNENSANLLDSIL
jgi:hypothetical protein